MDEIRSPLAVAPSAWRMARLSVLFLMDVARISRGEGDFLEPFIVTAMLQANQAALLTDPELQALYQDRDWALPDAHRRPISINAVAQSLTLPYETVRRRAQALAGRGMCVMTRSGAYVPQAAVTSQAYVRLLSERVERLILLHHELAGDGLQAGDPDLERYARDAPRAADRLLANYALRACGGLMELTGSVVDGVVLLALSAANVRELRVATVESWSSYAELARPCPTPEIAQALGMPGETVRRHLHRLAAAGFCERTPRGWIATAPAASQPLLGRLVSENAQNLRRLFAVLGELSTRRGGAHGVAPREAG